jgi:hypothetical protein
MTLRLADVPAGFQVDAGTGYYSVRQDAAIGSGPPNAATLRRHGFIVSYRAYFQRPLTLAPEYPSTLQIVSIATLYRTPAGAAWSISSDEARLRSLGASAITFKRRIADETRLYARIEQNSATQTLWSLWLIWRDGRVRAAVVVSGLYTGACCRLSARPAIALALAQEALIRNARRTT